MNIGILNLFYCTKKSIICKVGYVVHWVFWELVRMQFPYNGWCSFAVLSVMWSSPKHFIVQTSPEGLFRFEGPGFSTVQELIMHQFHSGLAVTSRSGTILKTPIAREEWELNNDDVQLVEKIGRGIQFFFHSFIFHLLFFTQSKWNHFHSFIGNFGDVYKANLRSKLTPVTTKSVAVKTCKVTLPEEHKKKFLQEVFIFCIHFLCNFFFS